jgi:hypothetical protein
VPQDLVKGKNVGKKNEKNICVDDLFINFTECERRGDTASRY